MGMDERLNHTGMVRYVIWLHLMSMCHRISHPHHTWSYFMPASIQDHVCMYVCMHHHISAIQFFFCVHIHNKIMELLTIYEQFYIKEGVSVHITCFCLGKNHQEKPKPLFCTMSSSTTLLSLATFQLSHKHFKLIN